MSTCNLFTCSILTFYLGLFTSVAFAASPYNSIFEMDENGNVVAVWMDAAHECCIEANTCVSGVWGVPKAVMSGAMLANQPIIGVNAIGGSDISAVVVWSDDTGMSNTGLFTAMLPSALGSWTTPSQITLGPTESVDSVYSVRVHTDGTVVIVFDVYDNATSIRTIQSVTSIIDNNNSFSLPVVIS